MCVGIRCGVSVVCEYTYVCLFCGGYIYSYIHVRIGINVNTHAGTKYIASYTHKTEQT